jgi:hypothetical protein
VFGFFSDNVIPWIPWRIGAISLLSSARLRLIGLIFVVVSLGADHAKAGDEHRARVGVIPTLVNFAVLLVSALRAVILSLIGRAGRLSPQSCPCCFQEDQG